MIHFANSSYLFLLIIIPLMILIKLGMDLLEKRKLKKYGDIRLIKDLMPDRSVLRQNLKFILLCLILACIILMLARPQAGLTVDNTKREGIEAIICMDVSNSMLAEDVQPSRIEKAKMMVSKLIDGFSDDKIGLVVFAGEAFTQMPITADFVSAKMFLDNISPKLVESQGTDLEAAINLAMNSFTKQKNVGKAIVIITDGEDHEGGAEEAARKAAKMGMRVYVLGIGSEEGAPFRMMGEQDYKHDQEGNVVMTRLNQDMCRLVAQAGQGAYIHVDNSNSAQDALEKELDKLSKAEFEVSFDEYDEQFWVFGLICIILMLAEMFIMEKKNPRFSKIKLFRKK